MKIDNLINNKKISSEQYIDIVDPGRNEVVVAKVAQGTVEDAENAVNCAHNAFIHWRNLNIDERLDYVGKAASVLEQSIPELSKLLAHENGALYSETLQDFGPGVGIIQFTMGLAKPFLSPEIIEDQSVRIEIEKMPRGVVTAIIPWNMPIVLTMMKLAPALLTGNTIVVKPSPFAPAALTEALSRMASVLPPGVINVVNGGGDVGQTLTEHRLVRKISFTGGGATSAKIMASAGKTAKNVTLELGGNDPAIILEDAEPSDVVPKLVRGMFTRSGQICFAVKRVYLPRNRFDEFFEAIVDQVDKIKVGHCSNAEATMGPVNNENQFKQVADLIAQARESGADVLELGQKLDEKGWENGYFIRPHLVKNIDNNAPLVCCEQFGPVVPIIPYDSIDQVVKYANETELGLCSSVWSQSTQKAVEVARQIEAGTTFINSHNLDSVDPRMPFGGVKQSGLGREFTELSLADFIEYHAIKYDRV